MDRQFKSLFLDFGDTLVRLSDDFVVEAADMISKYQAVQITGYNVRHAWDEEWEARRCATRIDQTKKITKPDQEKKFWIDFSRSFLVRMGIKDPEAELISWLSARWGSGDSYEPFPGVMGTLQLLKQKGVILVLVSNAFPSVWDLIRKTNLVDLFDHLVLSYECGSQKPEPKIYQYALDKAGVNPEEALFLDDDEGFVIGAEQLKIRSALINHNGNNKIKRCKRKKTKVFNNFSELCALFS